MCRLLAYLGKEKVLMQDLIETPENSLVKQSKAAKEGIHGVNADGFGVAWYTPSLDPTPGIFRSTQPAWNDSNLKHLGKKIASSCFLGHIRASTVGDVSLTNCHPFAYKNYSYVHNGTIRRFEKLKIPLINEIGSELFPCIKGQTDSEYFFFLIMKFVHVDPEKNLEKAMKRAFQWVAKHQDPEDESHFSRLNIVITDGKEMLATRFVNKGHDALSLNYHYCPSTENPENTLLPAPCLVIASEPLNDCSTHWITLPMNHYLKISSFNTPPEVLAFS